MEQKIKTFFRNFSPDFPDWLYKLVLAGIIVSVPLVPSLVYLGVRIPTLPFFDGMATQSKHKAQSVGTFIGRDGKKYQVAMERPPVEGTIPQGYSKYPHIGIEKEDLPNGGLSNPLAMNEVNLKRGRRVYRSFCLPCHGEMGGAGGVFGNAVGIGRLPAPKTLVGKETIDLTDGQLFHVVTVGQNENKMPSYATQIRPVDRWAAILYLRAIQRSQNPTAKDMAAAGIVDDGKTTGTQSNDSKTTDTDQQE